MFYIFLTTSRFDGSNGFQAYLVFQPVHKYFEVITNIKHITEWKSKGLSDESIKPLPTSNNSLAPLIDYYGYKIKVKFNGSILRQPNGYKIKVKFNGSILRQPKVTHMHKKK